MSVEVRGLVVVGTRTPAADAMSASARDVLWLAAVAHLRAAGVETDEVAESEAQRWVHRAPDGRLHELVQSR